MDLRDFLDNTHESSEKEDNRYFIPEIRKYKQYEKKKEERELNFLDIFIPKLKRKFKQKKYRILSDQTTYMTLDYLYYKKKYLENKEYTIDLNEMFDTSKNLNVKRYMKQKEYEKTIQKNFNFEKNEKLNKTIWDYKEEIKEKSNELISVPVSIVNWEENICNIQLKNFNIRNNLIIEEIFDRNNFEKKILNKEKNIKNIKPFPKLFDCDPFLVFDNVILPINNKKKKINIYNFSKDEAYTLKVDGETFLMKRGASHIKEAIELSERIFPSKYSKESLRNYLREYKKINILFKYKEYKFQIKKKEELFNSYKTLEDLSLKNNNSEVCIIEYLEQYPPLIQKPGMVSILESYYRKSNKKTNIPNVFNLESGDPSPFLFNIKPNSIVNSLSNNLFKAPVFKHKPKNLLLLIFPNYESNILTLKKINDLRLAGQVFPSEEVYSPNTRKFGSYSKNRLKVDLLNTLLYNKTQKIITLSDLDKRFPHFTEGQKRRLLREFCIIYKKGKENIYLLNENIILFRNDVLRLCTPENACQHEGLLFGEQRIKDTLNSNSLHSSIITFKDNKLYDEEENNLSPWVLSKNYINSKKGRGMLELSGLGDPSRRGICISFEKSKFNRDLDPKKYSSEALKEYRKTIDDIFNKMEIACSNINNIDKPKLIEESLEEENIEPLNNKKILIIKRTTFDIKLNKNIIKEEKIFNNELIDLYLKMKTNQISNKLLNDKKPLKCGACGEFGHMKTSKKCIKFIETAKKSPIEQKKSLKNLNNLIINCLNLLCNIKFTDAFIKPVSKNIYPEYYDIIENPISFSDMKLKAKNQIYKNFKEFEKDIELLKNNCIQFNGPDHSLTQVTYKIIQETLLYRNNKKELIEFNEKIIN